MKYVAPLIVLAIVYVVLARQSPIRSVQEAVTETEVAPLTQGSREPVLAHSNAFKQPLDRTHAVLEQVKKRNGDGEF